MQKTKLGISVGLLGAAIYFIQLFQGCRLGYIQLRQLVIRAIQFVQFYCLEQIQFRQLVV